MKNIDRLIKIQQKSQRYFLGLMSGTSLDGLDIALCRFEYSGYKTKWSLENFITLPYTEEFRYKVRKVFANADAKMEDLCYLDRHIAEEQGKLILEAMSQWGLSAKDVDVIASHGQTVYHAPSHQSNAEYNVTLQLGDGDFIAQKTGILTVSDFRQKHIAAGGEGAPLAMYGDELLFASPDEDRILLNIGGIANFTFLPKLSGKDLNLSPLSSDTGPGNTIMDAFVLQQFGQPYDVNGQIADRGRVNLQLLDNLMSDPFFDLPLPKTTGPEVFNLDFLQRKGLTKINQSLNPEDVLATLSSFSAKSMAKALRPYLDKATRIYISGGGGHNPHLLRELQSYLPDIKLHQSDEIGIPGDAKEAVLFAVLANELLFGDPQTYRPLGAKMPSCVMGKISFP
ncbi:anhydro-N-acetylmuramic acid kinase [Membranihabitans marinus]|uniref:anhydro-N-acetylmuramic acid kinase n=1 Tax=Membranihabitans marinus TaxID=1227546 RepID=UPI001F1B7D1E|nr:anhydro-N-acetylmuramic acid kinase [Membranihabitans marinus]